MIISLKVTFPPGAFFAIGLHCFHPWEAPAQPGLGDELLPVSAALGDGPEPEPPGLATLGVWILLV